MAFDQKNWVAREGSGLNKFIIGEKDANGKQTITNSPDEILLQGDVLNVSNLNDLEARIKKGFKDLEPEIIPAGAPVETNMSFSTYPFRDLTPTPGGLVVYQKSYKNTNTSPVNTITCSVVNSVDQMILFSWGKDRVLTADWKFVLPSGSRICSFTIQPQETYNFIIAALFLG